MTEELKIMIWTIVMLSIKFLEWTETHVLPPMDSCQAALVCTHDMEEVCGTTPDGRGQRLFLDLCDLHEYNCDFGTGYEQKTCEKDPTTAGYERETCEEPISPTSTTRPPYESESCEDEPPTTATTYSVTSPTANPTTRSPLNPTITSTNFTTLSTNPTTKTTTITILSTTTTPTTAATAESTTTITSTTTSTLSTTFTAASELAEPIESEISKENGGEKLSYTVDSDPQTINCPGNCGPESWLTTAKGETRDFYRILNDDK